MIRLVALRRVKALEEASQSKPAPPVRRISRPARARSGKRQLVLSATPSPRRNQFSDTSQMGCAIRVLEAYGKELHVDEILRRMAARGVEAPKASVVGGMFRLAKERRIFYKAAAPNSFGLLVWKQERAATSNGAVTMSP
jgi:hypothetical protein